jgi:pimeloyl-ACP methyl ester carboxylesterase
VTWPVTGPVTGEWGPADGRPLVFWPGLNPWAVCSSALVLLDAGHTDVTLDRTRAELVAEFEADQADFVFESWDGFFEYARERVRSWRPELEPRYRAGMTERAGKIVPLASPRAAAWALHGVAAEPPSSQHRRLSMPVLLVLARVREDREARTRFEAAVPHAEVVVLDSGHDIPEDVPHELVELVSDRLGDLT